jgi:Zn-dependent protease with chaperone function
MKNYYQYFISICLFFVSCNFCLAQNKIENVIVVEFESPYDVVTILVDEEQYDYQITQQTEFKDNNKKKIIAELFTKGCAVDLSYRIESKKRFATKLQLISKDNAGKENFTGVFELLEGDLAYIDGKKVKLAKDAKIDCSLKSKCSCKKGMTYLDFTEVRKGDFVTINGVSDKGYVFANQVTVCKNEYTDTDRNLRTSVENSYNAAGTHVVAAPTGIVVPPNSLYQGNIKIGTLEYKLLDDIRAQGYVNMVGNRLLPDYAKEEAWQKKHEIFFRFYVIHNPIPNAFAFPNGMVFIHTGLLKLMENEAQLACVLGHEIAHVTYEHSSSRFQSQGTFESAAIKSTGGKLLGKVLDAAKDATGMDNGGLGDDLIDGLGRGIAQTKPSDISNLFEKSKETQADRVGLLYAYLAGYDIREATKFWQIMSQKTGEETFQSKMKTDAKGLLNQNAANFENKNFISSLTEEMTSTVVGNYLETIYTSHPLTQKRLKDINQLLLTTYQGEDFSKFSAGKVEYIKFITSIK